MAAAAVLEQRYQSELPCEASALHRSVFIRGIQDHLSHEDVGDLLRECGELSKVRVSRNFCSTLNCSRAFYVEFVSEEGVQKMISRHHNPPHVNCEQAKTPIRSSRGTDFFTSQLPICHVAAMSGSLFVPPHRQHGVPPASSASSRQGRGSDTTVTVGSSYYNVYSQYDQYYHGAQPDPYSSYHTPVQQTQSPTQAPTPPQQAASTPQDSASGYVPRQRLVVRSGGHGLGYGYGGSGSPVAAIGPQVVVGPQSTSPVTPTSGDPDEAVIATTAPPNAPKQVRVYPCIYGLREADLPRQILLLREKVTSFARSRRREERRELSIQIAQCGMAVWSQRPAQEYFLATVAAAFDVLATTAASTDHYRACRQVLVHIHFLNQMEDVGHHLLRTF